MFQIANVDRLDDFFIGLNERREKSIYFCRLNSYSKELDVFLKKYYDCAIKNGVVIEGKIPNPDEKNLSYYSEIMGMDFVLTLDFIDNGLKKWLPRMNDFQRQNVASSILNQLQDMKKNGKTDNILKNVYIKFMCWLYYKFERIINLLGNNSLPKILYEGDVSSHELLLLSVLSKAGCDIVLVQKNGEQNYLKHDSKSQLSFAYGPEDPHSFPEDFSIKKIRQDILNNQSKDRLYGQRPSVDNCTNAWIDRIHSFEIIKESVLNRGKDDKFFYNCFYRINGVEDKVVYVQQLCSLEKHFEKSNRHYAIVNGKIPAPSPEEINEIKRGNYANVDQLILGLSSNIIYAANPELQRIMKKSFVDTVLEIAENDGSNLNKITNKAVYLLCWLKRYSKEIFSNWKMPEISAFIYFGACKNENESIFLKMLARLPVDVLILCPNLNEKCLVNDSLLYEESFEESLPMEKFPDSSSQIKMGTVANHAENELTSLLYNDSGVYRTRQFSKANVICLQTMYEEIPAIWNTDLNFRMFFKTEDGVVNIPAIFAKVCGIKNGNVSDYWNSIRNLVTEETVVVKNFPWIESGEENIYKSFATDFYRNGKLLKSKIKNHPQYPFGILREEMQDFVLEKLDTLIQMKLIKGIGENGMEYTVIAQVLNMPKEIFRLIQKFDFTKRNPKMIFVNTNENILSLEDSIMVAFLNLIGFDIIFFVPTGYQCVEKHFTKKLMEEHQVGEYKYDLTIPDLTSNLINRTKNTLFGKIFKRGN